ncbi:Uncharacterized protein Adt_11844 [Abeliophyllum distichum]|uniref:Uncharacterized protein n=1 Tax=Abeliophyllum distichum TaxID=126358 RepID=A0ABD1UQG9_9LAMI
MAVSLPRDFKQPKMEKYDGSSDPVDHLRVFVNLMRLQATPDAMMYRAFSPTLRRGSDEETKPWLKKICQGELTHGEVSQLGELAHALKKIAKVSSLMARRPHPNDKTSLPK